ncbi:MAG TPA: hypothetical protein VFV33_21830 [Gemmatimonadaceae bacterium]|nr:hypothetical protein [Gemmatimonadaceae bacterium]
MNPHEPYVYHPHLGEIRITDDLGGRHEADIYQSRAGWRWSARYDAPTGAPIDTMSTGPHEANDEASAVAAAVAWLRAVSP